MKRALSIISVLAAVSALAASSHGDPFFYEGFDYAEGELGAPWSILDGKPPVVSPGLTYQSLITEGNRVQGSTNHFHNISTINASGIGERWNTDGSFYMTYLFERINSTTFYVNSQMTIEPSAGGNPSYYMNVPWRDDSNGINDGVDTVIGFVGADGTPDTVSINPFGEGIKMIAAKFTMDTAPGAADEIAIVLNPSTLATEPNWEEATWTLSSDVTTLPIDPIPDTIRIHTRNWNNAEWDEIRIGDTWADVAPIPEPATSVLLGLGGLLVLLRRRLC